jgi:hypothetical protein
MSLSLATSDNHRQVVKPSMTKQQMGGEAMSCALTHTCHSKPSTQHFLKQPQTTTQWEIMALSFSGYHSTSNDTHAEHKLNQQSTHQQQQPKNASQQPLSRQPHTCSLGSLTFQTLLAPSTQGQQASDHGMN